MKRLLMISYPFPPNASAGAVRSARFAGYLPQFGWEVDAVTIKPRPEFGESEARVQRLGNCVRIHATPTFDPYLRLLAWKPRWLPLKAIRSAGLRITSFPDHMFFWIPFAVMKAMRLHRTVGFDAIYSTSPPHSSHLAGVIVSRLAGKPLVVDFRDPWSQNAYHNALRTKGWLDTCLSRIERGMEQAVLKKAAAILANTRINRTRLLDAFDFLNPGKVLFMPNGWEPFATETGLPLKGNPFAIVHAGVFYPKFAPFALLHALAHWRRAGTPKPVPDAGNLKVILLGCRNVEARALVENLSLQDVVQIYPWAPLDEAHAMMCQADLLWATLGTGPDSASYVPSKIYEYIAAGRPIIGFFPEGEAADLIRETGTGIVFTSDEPHRVILTLHDAMATRAAGGPFPAFYSPDAANIEQRKAVCVARKLSDLLHRIASSVYESNLSRKAPAS